MATRYHSLSEGAQYAGCSVRFLQRRISRGELVSFLVGGRRFLTFDEIDRMMQRNRNVSAQQNDC